MPSAIALLVALVLPALQPPPLDQVLTRAGTFVTAYRFDAGRLMADESFVELWGSSSSSRGSTQTTLSDFAMIADEDGMGWRGFRDVVSVDGKPVPEHVAGRLAGLLGGSGPEGADSAARITAKSRTYLLRPSEHFPASPPVALMVLLPSEQSRFVFTERGQKKVEGVAVTVVRFKEVRGPGFFRDAEGNDMAMTGEFWIEPRTGAVLRSNFSVEGKGLTGQTSPVMNYGPTRISVEVRYRNDPALGTAVPVEMRQIVSRDVGLGFSQGASGADGGSGGSNPRREELTCVSTYSNHRKLPRAVGSSTPFER